MLKLTRIAAVALIALALLLAVVAFLVSRRAAPTVVAAPQVAGQPQQWPVVEAAGELPAGRPISAADLRIGSAPQAPQGGYASIAEATGAVPVHAIAAGTALNSALMARGYALRLNPGERALAVPVDELVAAGNRILPGDYVDVFLNLRAPQGMGTEGQAQARLLLSRMRVLSYGAADTAPGQAAPTDTASEASTDARAQDIQGSASSTSSTSTAHRCAARFWRCRSPRPTACCWAHSRVACSWRCATRPMWANPTRNCSPSPAACWMHGAS